MRFFTPPLYKQDLSFNDMSPGDDQRTKMQMKLSYFYKYEAIRICHLEKSFHP